jgi:hypothetical protein
LNSLYCIFHFLSYIIRLGNNLGMKNDSIFYFKFNYLIKSLRNKMEKNFIKKKKFKTSFISITGKCNKNPANSFISNSSNSPIQFFSIAGNKKNYKKKKK